MKKANRSVIKDENQLLLFNGLEDKYKGKDNLEAKSKVAIKLKKPEPKSLAYMIKEFYGEV